MTTKTFRAPNMLQVLEQVRHELGDDAIVVSMRKVPGGPSWQIWRNPAVEVIAMNNPNSLRTHVASAYKNPPQTPVAVNSDIEVYRESKNDPSVSETVQALSHLKKKTVKNLRPFNPPHITSNEGKTSIDNLVQQTLELEKQALNILYQTKPLQDNNQSVKKDLKRLELEKKPTKIKPVIEKTKNKTSVNDYVDYSPSVETEPEVLPPLLLQSYLQAQPIPQVSNQPQRDIQSQQKNQITINLPKSKKSEIELWSLSSQLYKAHKQLLDQGVDEELILKTINFCLDVLPTTALEDDLRVRYMLQRQLEAEIRILGKQEVFIPKSIFFIGSSGAGKTNTCAKLAAYSIHKCGKNIAWICADTVRTGGIAQARTFTELLNVPLQIAYTPKEMEEGINTEANADCIFIDTADCNPRNENSVVELGNFITQISVRSVYIIIPATTKEVDLKQTIAAFKPFRIKGLIITKMDETLTFGSVFNIAWRSQIPLAFFCTGTHVLNDLRPASAQLLVDALFGEGLV